jgi:hypothetical protein
MSTVWEPEGLVAVENKIIVLSDNDGLARAIEVNLERCCRAEVVHLVGGTSGRYAGPFAGDCHLIIVALSSPASEPIVALAQASLVGRIGQVPLLIISDRPFESDPVDRIAHLDFPFDVDELCCRVQRILRDQVVADQTQLYGGAEAAAVDMLWRKIDARA